MAWRATEILRRQPGFWQRLAGCLPDAAQRSLALSPAAAASAQDDEEAEAGEEAVKEWLRKGDTAWRLSAESSALQLLALEAFASPPGPGALTHPSSAPCHLIGPIMVYAAVRAHANGAGNACQGLIGS